MNDHAQLFTSPERAFLDSVCEGAPRVTAPERPERLFERHAAAAPDTIALRHRDRTLTFGELNRRANQLSHLLAGRGIGAESRVVVCADPSFDVVIALLAILKAGAAYVPVDPNYPAPHVKSILDDTRPALVIASRSLSKDAGCDAETILLADLPSRTSGYPDTDLERRAASDATAYVFYTSGTTGKPKGVMASYDNLAYYVAAARERYEFTSADVMPAIARFSFSISLFELLTPLSAGGTLLLLDREHVLDPERLAAAIANVTIFHAGPSLLRPLLDHIERHHADVSAFDGVRHASSGGDSIPPDVLEAAKRIFRKAEIFVIYGSSEIACMGCTYPVPRDRRITKTYVGRPFDGMSVRIVNDALERVPVGEVGEVCFTGAGVVKGYLNRDELTQSKFVDIEGRRFYRMGDLGRVTEEGFVQLVGRVDFQAKIRGMRVELPEVEHHLRAAPGVKDGVVMPRDGADGEKVLVAYVVLEGAAAGTEGSEPACAAAIRRHMVAHLPDYMVPAIYLELPRLPLNHNMKVDRRALPAPGRPAERPRHGREPETATERALAGIWERLLGVEDVRLDDNFFELGGHSLLAVGFLHSVETELGAAPEGMDVLRESLEVLARICDERLGRSAPRGRSPAARPAEDRDELLYFGGGGDLYGVLTLPASATVEHAVLVAGPVAQESARSHFVLAGLTRRLAARGVASLRFDYFGTGDSLGEGREASCARWMRDLEEARAELVRRTGARRLTALGVRLGATLLGNAASRLDVERLVLWDPVASGAEHVDILERLQREYLRGRDALSLPRRGKTHGHELLGTTYSDEALAELRALVLPPAPSGIPARWLVTTEASALHAAMRNATVSRLDVDCNWYTLSRLEDTIPDAGIAAMLASLCTEAP